MTPKSRLAGLLVVVAIALSSAACTDDPRMCGESIAGKGSTLWALDPATGQERWRTDLEPVMPWVFPDEDDGLVRLQLLREGDHKDVRVDSRSGRRIDTVPATEDRQLDGMDRFASVSMAGLAIRFHWEPDPDSETSIEARGEDDGELAWRLTRRDLGRDGGFSHPYPLDDIVLVVALDQLPTCV
jgi:hypothetical protein